MLDESLKEQLKTVFAKLTRSVALVYEPSFHADQNELTTLLGDVVSTSEKLSTRLEAVADGRTAPFPTFHIEVTDGAAARRTGVTFKGIPGGHEFSSLILAILNASGEGKLPDPVLQKRIRRLRGPVRVRTFISLTCENCPDVVQALNQMALLHKNFHHEMIDGGYAQDEVEALKIQGVPSVVIGEKLISSGRISFLDLLKKLEDEFGVNTKATGDESDEASTSAADLNLGHFDVVVVGGGPAGASAAIYSVRKGLKTALLSDRFGGQVQDTRGIENLISVPYTEGPKLAADLNKHLTSYPVQILEHRKVKTIKTATVADTAGIGAAGAGAAGAGAASARAVKTLELESGEHMTADAVIVTTGAKWRELNVPGEKEYLGRGVAFCPHCDGPFYKGKKIAVVGGGNSGVEAAIDLAGIVREVILIEYNAELKADQILVDKLRTLSNVQVLTNARTDLIKGDGSKVIGLEYLDRATETKKTLDLEGIFVQIGLIPNSQFLKGVVELTKYGEVVVDYKGHTSIPGIYAAGDVTTTPYKQIVIAMGEGAKAALAAFEDRMLAH
jgi:NADH-dependent peroxiredoxin subunit F